ncbi:MAG: hypothetical protein ACYTFY_02255 [Planctomycetota bacterium]|jgi:hypothetical protein
MADEDAGRNTGQEKDRPHAENLPDQHNPDYAEQSISATEIIPRLDSEDDEEESIDKTLILTDTGNDSDEYVPEYAFDVGFDFEDDEEETAVRRKAVSRAKPEAEQEKEKAQPFRSIMNQDSAPDREPEGEAEEELLGDSGDNEADSAKTIVTAPPDRTRVDPTQVLDTRELEQFGIIPAEKTPAEEGTFEKPPSEQLTIVDSDELRAAAEEMRQSENQEKLPQLEVDGQLHDSGHFLQEETDTQDSDWDVMQGSFDEISDDEGFGVESILPEDSYSDGLLPTAQQAGAELDSDDTDLSDIMRFTKNESDEGDDFGNISGELPDENDFFNSDFNAGDALADDEFNNMSLGDIESPEADFHNIDAGIESSREADFENVPLSKTEKYDDAEVEQKQEPAELPEVSLAPPQGFDAADDDDEMLLEPYELGDGDEELEQAVPGGDNNDFGTGDVMPDLDTGTGFDEMSGSLAADDQVADILDSTLEAPNAQPEELMDIPLGADTDMQLPEAADQEFGAIDELSADSLDADDNINDILSAANQEADMQAEEILQTPAELPGDELELNENIIPEDDEAMSFDSAELTADSLDDSALIIEENTGAELEESALDDSELMSADFPDSGAEDLLEIPAGEEMDEDIAADLLKMTGGDDESLDELNLPEDASSSDSVNIPALDLGEDIAQGSEVPPPAGLEEGEGAESPEQPIEDIFAESQEDSKPAPTNWSDALEPVPLNILEEEIIPGADDLSSALYMDGDSSGINLTAPIEDGEIVEVKSEPSKIFNVLKNIKKLVMLIGRRVDQIVCWTANWRVYLGVVSAIIITICTAIWIGSYMDSGGS